MITKTRLKELVIQRATIYGNGFGEIALIPDNDISIYENGDNGYILYILEPNKKYKNEIFDEELFESKEEAEEYLEFANIERIEKFPFIPYKEFIKPTNIIFKSKDNVEMELAVWFNSESEIDSETIKLTELNDWNICYFEKPLTQENYHEVLRVCRKLFLGD